MRLNDLAKRINNLNQRWWQDPETGKEIKRNKGELLSLVHSELSEAYLGDKHGLMDDKLPERSMTEVELADALIRVFDYSGGFGYDLNHPALDWNFDDFTTLNSLGKYLYDEVSSIEGNTTPVLTDDSDLLYLHLLVTQILESERKSKPEVYTAKLIVELIVSILICSCNRGLDMSGAMEEKLAFNAQRQDHTHEARLVEGGKKW